MSGTGLTEKESKCSFLYVEGSARAFQCEDCGGKLFHRTYLFRPGTWQCNECGTRYTEGQ